MTYSASLKDLINSQKRFTFWAIYDSYVSTYTEVIATIYVR